MSLIRLATGTAPRRVSAQWRAGPTGVDIATLATLEYADGAVAQLHCAMDMALHRHGLIVGTEGSSAPSS